MGEKKSTARAEEQGSLDRRSFLRGAALVGAGTLAAGALAACAPNANGNGDAANNSADGATGGSVTGPIGGAICADDWLGTMPQIAESAVSETVDVDVVVLGGGHAGTQAALAAAQAGAMVAVVEKQTEEKYVYFGDDICGYNSQWITEKGFGGYNTAEITAEYCRRGVGRVLPGLIKLFVEKSGEMFDNMASLVPETSDLLDYEGGRCVIQVAYGKNSGSDYPIEQSGYKSWATTVQTAATINPTEVIPGRKLTRLTEIETYSIWEAERLGATWYWGHSAEALILDGDAVTGAYALKPDGSYLRLNAAKGVLLATGDFSSNPDMVWNLLDDVAEWGSRIGLKRGELIGPGRDGMGHKLGCWAGGAIEPHPRGSMNIMGGQPGPWGTSAFLTLNKNGKRFMNESMSQLAGAACMRQPLGIIAAVMDANFMKYVQGAGLDHGAPNWGYPPMLAQMEADMHNIVPGPEGGPVTSVGIVSLNEINTHDPEGEASGESSMPPSIVYAANTLEELLGYLGYSGAELQTALSEIARYNELCQQGLDADYAKQADLMIPIEQAPFYGAVTENTGRTSPGLVTLTGLLTDENLNVMKADRSAPIKGLYAAGNTVGQRYSIGYSTPSAGNSMGMAMTHGREAGKIIAAL
ncbi:MAG: FAD-binding protein [Coriobacteriales bacterium]|jgi:succinate dehydrogenase/fumarate reductase flavoprotein subunit|nr:FAD-binding protein [Coriobacteriales bacterium]